MFFAKGNKIWWRKHCNFGLVLWSCISLMASKLSCCLRGISPCRDNCQSTFNEPLYMFLFLASHCDSKQDLQQLLEDFDTPIPHRWFQWTFTVQDSFRAQHLWCGLGLMIHVRWRTSSQRLIFEMRPLCGDLTKHRGEYFLCIYEADPSNTSLLLCYVCCLVTFLPRTSGEEPTTTSFLVFSFWQRAKCLSSRWGAMPRLCKHIFSWILTPFKCGITAKARTEHSHLETHFH